MKPDPRVACIIVPNVLLSLVSATVSVLFAGWLAFGCVWLCLGSVLNIDIVTTIMETIRTFCIVESLSISRLGRPQFGHCLAEEDKLFRQSGQMSSDTLVLLEGSDILYFCGYYRMTRLYGARFLPGQFYT